jgi:hypothetical protein
MDYDDEVISDISEGCDKLQDLKDAVADFVGDSDDIVYGLFGEGVDTDSVNGCGGAVSGSDGCSRVGLRPTRSATPLAASTPRATT